MADFNLTAEQEAEAARIEDVMLAAMRGEAKRIGRLLASKENRELFGRTEFQLRDILLGLGARSLDAALSERKRFPSVRVGAKRGTEVAASAVRTARRTRGSSATARPR